MMIINRFYIVILSVLLSIYIIFICSGCDPPARIQVKNETQKTLTIFVGGVGGEGGPVRAGDVGPGKEITTEALALIYWKYYIEARMLRIV
ncbi:hypothetical protein ACFLRP_00855 [Bacteroidota bacterium]